MSINSLKLDLMSSDWIREKVKDDRYAQNLYAALCNNDFIKNEVLPILREEFWSCSWRHAGGIVADLRDEGDYMSWYCSGMMWDSENLPDLFVSEGTVTDEIRNDLLTLGWTVKE